MADIQSFVAQYGPVAASVGQQIGVSPDVLLGQWGEETGWGKSVVPGTNNLGNIKGPGVAATDNALGTTDTYRTYQSPAAFGAGFAGLIGSKYPSAVGTGSDAQAFATALHKGGYAQDPAYPAKVSAAVNAVRGLGNFLASAISGTANAAQPMPDNQPDLSNDPVWQMMTGATRQQQAATAPAQLSNDPTWQMMNATVQGASGGGENSGKTPGTVARQMPAGGAEGVAADLAAGGSSPWALSDLRDALSAGGHGIGSLASNAANLAEKGIAGTLNLIPGVRDTALARAATNVANSDVAAQSAADTQFQQTASPGEKAAAFLAPALLPVGGALKGASAAGDAAANGLRMLPGMGSGFGSQAAGMTGKAVGNALVGAGFGAGSPVDPNSPYLPQVVRNIAGGAALNTVIPAMGAGARAIGSNVMDALRPVISPRNFVGQGLADAVGDQASAVASSIRTAPQYVAGSQPTLAQVAGTPTLVATEKAAFNSVPGFAGAFLDRANENNAARMASLASVAQTPAALEAAARTREAAVQPAYNAAQAATYQVDPDLEDLLKRPAVQDALARGINIAKNRGNQGFIPGSAGTAAQFANVPTGATGFNGSPLLQQLLIKPATPGQPAQISGDVLHYIKLGLDDLQANADESTRIGPFERAAIGNARQDYLSWLDNTSPDYRQARETYAAMSPAINSMDAGQFIQNKIGGIGRNLNSAGDVPAAAQGYAQALQQALGRQEYGIDPADQATLENIGRDLQRATISNSIRTGGSDTAYNLGANGMLAQQLYGKGFGGAGNLAKGVAALGATAAGHPLVGLGLFGTANKLGQAVGGRLQNQLSDFLLNPDGLLPFLDRRANVNGSPVNNLHQAVQAGLLRYGRPVALGGLLGAFQNAP